MKKINFTDYFINIEKLRGAFEVSELNKVALYALLFKHFEKEKKNLLFYDEKFSLGYLSLTYGKMVDSNQILDYLIQSEKYYNIEPGVLKETCSIIFNKVDAASIRIIFEIINSIEMDTNFDLYEFAKVIIERLSIQSGKMEAANYSSNTIVKMEKMILDAKPGMKVYDGYCGSGLSANEVAGGKGTIFLQDVSIHTIGIAAILSILSGNEIGTIRCGDSIQNPISMNNKYDRIIIEAPFAVKYFPEYLISIENENALYADYHESETLAIRHAIAHLDRKGLALALVPMGILFKAGKTREMRKRLVDDGYIDTIIELPSGIISSTLMATAFVIINKKIKERKIFIVDSKTFFVKEKRGYSISDEKILELSEILRNKKNVMGISVSVNLEEFKKNEYNLCTEQYVNSNPKNKILVENTVELLERYKKLEEEFCLVSRELENIRTEFCRDTNN